MVQTKLLQIDIVQLRSGKHSRPNVIFQMQKRVHENLMYSIFGPAGTEAVK